MRFTVSHRTAYRYEQTMNDGFTVAHLRPRGTEHQRVIASEIRIEPSPDELDEVRDEFGNTVTLFAVHRPHDSLVVEATMEVEVDIPEPSVGGEPWEEVAAQAALGGPRTVELGAYLAHTAATPNLLELRELTDPEFTAGRPIADAVRGLCARIFREFRFDAAATDVSTPLADVLANRHGVCQDFAHVSVAALRSIGLPARYVSGYIETLPAPGMPKLVGVDASHAWCSVWAGALGWLDADPTNDQMPPQRHVTVGWGRDYDDIAPVRGVVIGPGGGQTLEVAVDVAASDGGATD
jgi:transglutaminase-like putative cysteine protease